MKGRRPRLPELAALYLLIGLLLVVRRKRHFFLLVTLSLIIVAGDAAYWYGQKWHRNDLRVTYLSVGYGDAAVVEFPGSKVLLIDAGGSSPQGWDSGRSIIAPFLRSRRIKKVDYVLVTHPRVDHYGEMKSILEEVLPSEFWSSSLQAKTGRYRELEKTADGLGIERIVLRRNDGCRRVGEVRLCISYPLGENPLETSVVLRLTLGQYHFLFPGDIKKGDEQK
ncbi:MAG: MBL fold metallo-hydrolase, partial [Candidatus Binatia bacterium]|nr:MBL fold metallo-hydrolase [Candidatus Binatia bacterium]